MSRGNSSKQCSNQSSRLTEVIFNPFSCTGIKRPGKMTSFNFVRILWYYKVLSLLKHVAVAGKPITEVKLHYVLQRQDKRHFKHERIRKFSRRCVMSKRPKFYVGKRKRNCSNKLSRYFFGFIFRKKQFSPVLHFVRQIQLFSININFLLILNFNACHSNEVDFYNIISFELP